MAITIISTTVNALVITEDGVTKTVPRSFTNPQYQQLLGGDYDEVSRDGVQYKAFPFSQIIGDYLVALYSDGDAHAQSDRQIMVRKKISDLTNVLIEWEEVTFLENSTGVYNFSLLTDIMTDGETFTFKVWAVTKTSGVVTQQVSNAVVISGNPDPDIDGTYALWSKVRTISGKYYRTGYRVDLVNGWNTVLFESTDQTTWAIKGVIAKGHGSSIDYNETDFVETTPGNYLAVIREDSGAGRPIYTSTSADLITWTAPVLSTDLEGTQPNILKTTDGTIILAVGDRTGVSGFDSGGKPNSTSATTGIELYKSADNGSTWSIGTNIDKGWSTDCGQPVMEEVSPNVIGMFYYNALGPTTTTTEPGIMFKQLTKDNVV